MTHRRYPRAPATVAAVLPATVNFDLVIDVDFDGREPARYRVRGLDVHDDQSYSGSDSLAAGDLR